MAPTTRSQTKAATTRRLDSPCEPPVYSVDLSAPPEERYQQICADYKSQLEGIIPIYDDILRITRHPRILDALARKLLRRVHSTEETREMRGIATATSVPMHLVVAFNTFLDLMSGCSSGGARVADAAAGGGVVHFRGLDWEMPALRQLMICVDYVRAGSVVARAVTYAGYTGVLTGVREGLSISLNYRARIGSPSSVFFHRLHQAALLFGFRPSIPSVLRQLLLSPLPPSLASIAETFPSIPSTPAYLTFCAPDKILILEKDLVTATIRQSNGFLAVTNHDQRIESLSPDAWREIIDKDGPSHMHGDDMILRDSMERKQCVMKLWTERTERDRGRLTMADVRQALEEQPVANECTHFSCIMDPGVRGGGLVWVRAYYEPIEMDLVDVSSIADSSA
ncbi:NAAA-beta domain-containing protein [Mycena kentingensis (nom. inval.)]|nr:NAAA-beta domain-containing protein [Mycena kentingensis (nom. inval.)]